MKSVEFLNSVSEKINFKRKKYDNENVPTDLEDILIVPFFGDLKHLFVLSCFLLNNFKKEKNTKYLILISYPGFEHLFTYVDEYWNTNDLSDINQIFIKSDYLENRSIFFTNLIRTLNENFRNVINPTFFKKLYYNKFTDLYWENFNFETNFFIPMVPSSSVIEKESFKLLNNKNNKVFLFPSQTINVWGNGKYNKVLISKNFYIELINYLKENKIFPVIWNNNFSYDLNDEFKSGIDCLIVNSNNIFEILPVIRLSNFCLDIFNSISKLSFIARCPSLIFEERNKYFLTKEYEIDDLLNLKIPNKRVFTLSNSVIKGNKEYWRKELFKCISDSQEEYFSYIDKDTMPNTSEINQKMDISIIRKIKNKKLGAKFIKIKKLI